MMGLQCLLTCVMMHWYLQSTNECRRRKKWPHELRKSQLTMLNMRRHTKKHNELHALMSTTGLLTSVLMQLQLLHAIRRVRSCANTSDLELCSSVAHSTCSRHTNGNSTTQEKMLLFSRRASVTKRARLPHVCAQ